MKTYRFSISVSDRMGNSHYYKQVEGTLENAMREFKSIAHWQSGNVTSLRNIDTGEDIAIYGMNNKPGYTEPVPY